MTIPTRPLRYAGRHPRRFPRRDSRLLGLAAALALVVFVAGVPVVLLTIGAVPDPSAFSWSRLTAPDDGTLALQVLACVCWAAWAIFSSQLLAAIVSQVRGIRAPRLPGLVVPQLAADRLVAAAALLFVAVPATTALLPSPHADASPTQTAVPAAQPTTGSVIGSATVPPEAAHTPTSATASPTLTDPQSSAHTPSASPAPHLESYTVKRGDSLWRIAEDRFGDGARYVELVELNRAVLGGRPDFLIPGTALRVPTTEPPATDPSASVETSHEYVVRPGDTLTQIAATELGDAGAYPAIFEASRDTLQTDGRRLTDPDLIYAGWTLTIPGHPGSHGESDERPEPRHSKPRQDIAPPASTPGTRTDARSPETPPEAAPRETVPADPPTADTPGHTNSADASDDRSSQQQTSVDDTQDTRDIATPSWLLPGLAGAGSILGGALWLALRAQRRTQLRHRRPGTIVAPPPPELIPAERTARATASVIAPRVDTLDTALRLLPRHLRLLVATIGDDAIYLTLREPADLPEPWNGADTEWQIRIADVPAPPSDSFPPYPLLVSIGQDTDGGFVLLNLEELRTITVTGDPDRSQALARHIAAEIAVNPWASVTTVDLLGLGADLASFNLGRVRTHPVGDTAFIADLTRGLAAITAPSDPDDFSVAIIADTDGPAADLDELARAIQSVPGRSSAALIELAADPRPDGAHLEVTAEGRLREAHLGVDVAAAGLSDDEARACALLLDLTLDQAMVPVPPSTPMPGQVPGAVDGVEAVCDLGGALLEELTQPRDEHHEGPAGETSLLPLAAHVYADAAATTVEDVEVLAPRATPQAKAAVEAVDPDLDEDLARWESPTIASAKLTLLGPVGARTTGDAKTTAHRRPFYVELLAYLALHPRGATAAEIADAFGLKPDRVRVDMSQLRRWLGSDPRTNDPYLPKAVPQTGLKRGPVAGADTAAVYQVHGLLSDLDLFRRLRARGQSRGAPGIDDLISALRLVSGEPFTHLREDHWNWLLDGERWDHIMSAAIVDVGHIVTTHALADEDPELALWAAQVAYRASPYDEVAQLDIIAAEKAHGDDDQAAADLYQKILDRRDDHMPPIDIPARSSQVLGHKHWTTRENRPRRTG